MGGGRQEFGSRVVGGRLPGGQATLHIPFAGGWWVAEDRVGGGGENILYLIFIISPNLQSHGGKIKLWRAHIGRGGAPPPNDHRTAP